MSDILIVDDEKDIRELISEILIDEGFSTRLSSNSAECLSQVSSAPPSLLILDIWLKDSNMDGIDILKRVKIDYPQVPIVIISGHGNIEIAVSAIKQGAYDFIEKPFNIEQLLVVVRRAMETSSLRRENTELKQKDIAEYELKGESITFRNFMSSLNKVSKASSRVLISGSSGSGKKTSARYIHENSKQSAGNFIAINCSVSDQDELDRMLFGVENKDGLQEVGALEKANGGTIYLDEVAEMPLDLQGKLLKFLVDGTTNRIGSNKQLDIDLRVISSTSSDFPEKIKRKKFREDLFHRLNVVPLKTPSLSERIDDIPLLAKYFVEQLSSIYGFSYREFTNEALSFLQAMNWPGNIRQLKNLIERVLILGNPADKISSDELALTGAKVKDSGEKINLISSELAGMSLREAREIFERDYLTLQINRFGGNISKTAVFVEMERSALHRKLKSLGINSSQKI